MNKTKTYIMPNICGGSLFSATRLIDDLGVKLGTITYEENGHKVNTIIDQSIPQGAVLTGESILNLKVTGINPIQYLPSIYNKYDRKNGGFLKRYIWIFQHIFNSFTDKLDHLDYFFNPVYASFEFYSWLASWFAVNLEHDVPEDKLRFIVKEAVSLYKWRGTVLGLTKYLEIITGIIPKIRENEVLYNEYVIIDDKLVENPIYERSNAQSNFIVSFPVTADYFNIEMIKKIHQVIKSEKPAHTHYYVTFESQEEKEDVIDYSVIGISGIR